jgi:hypothetical protein
VKKATEVAWLFILQSKSYSGFGYQANTASRPAVTFTLRPLNLKLPDAFLVAFIFVLLLTTICVELSTLLLFALSKPVTPIKSTHKQILLHHYHLYHRTISGEKRCMCFWWKWGESNSRPRPVSLHFIQQ